MRLPLVVTACSLALAGCGGDDEARTVTETVTETRTVTETETVTETATGPGAPAGGPERGCGDIAFEPQTDNGAFDIRAAGVGCEVAREVARAAEDASGDYSASGFDCSGTVRENGLRTTEYTCTRDDGARVTFSRS